MNWRAGVKIFVALVLIFLGQPRMNMYLAEEAFTVLLVIAVLLILILLTVSAFLLLWQAARLVFLQLKGIVGWIVSIDERPLHAEQEPFITPLKRRKVAKGIGSRPGIVSCEL